MATKEQLAAVQQLYIGYLGRAADQAGQEFWANAIADGTSTIESVALGFTLSQEYQSIYGGLAGADLVAAVYENLLSREADAEGQAFWVGQLESGVVTADTLVATMINSLGAQDQATVNNKVFVAQTYTDTVGTEYSASGAASVIAGVTNDPATVADALNSISNGTVTGQVAGLNLVNALEVAEIAHANFDAANEKALDALIKELGSNNSGTFDVKLAAALTKAQGDRDAIGGGDDTKILKLKADLAADKLAAERAGLDKAEKAKAATYEAAVAKAAETEANKATDVEAGAAQGGLAAADGTGTALAGLTNLSAQSGFDAAAPTTTSELWDAYVAGTADDRAAIDKAFKDIEAYSTFKAAVSKDVAAADAAAALATAKAAADAGFVAAYEAKVAADKLVADAEEADATLAAVEMIAKNDEALNDRIDAADNAITKYNADNAGVAKIDGLGTITGGKTALDNIKETFYFNDKAALDTGADGQITNFGKGDAIVVGSGFTFNSGALADGNNNAKEFFLVQSGKDVLLVLEAQNYGSATTETDSNGNVTQNDLSAVSVITLTGVTVDQLTVENGAVSFIG